MWRSCSLVVIAAALSFPWREAASQSPRSAASQGSSSPANASAYLGFDRNQYPGDAALPALHRTFAFSGYWLNNPPGETRNDWSGKRQKLQAAGFGFLVLFNGRLDAELKTVASARRMGKTDAQAATDAARHEGFPAQTIIFLDQEEGGRMLPEQKAYIHAWVDGVTSSSFRAGIYCSGIGAKDDENVVTASDIRKYAGNRKITYFVTDDSCPPSSGCVFPKQPPKPALSGTRFADIWQFAQSPKRNEFAAECPANYNRDGNCYPPGIDIRKKLHIDVDTASSSDPSQGRSR